MTGGGFGQGGHDEQANRPLGAAGDPEQTVWGGAVSPQAPSSGASWEPPAVDYPQPGYPPPSPSYAPGPPGYQPPGYGGGSYPPGPPQYGPPPPAYPAYPQAAGYYAPVGNNGMAIGSLVSSIFGLLCCPIIGIVSVALGIVAINQIKQTNQDGHGMAIAGIVIGGVAIAWQIAIVVIYIAARAQ